MIKLVGFLIYSASIWFVGFVMGILSADPEEPLT